MIEEQKKTKMEERRLESLRNTMQKHLPQQLHSPSLCEEENKESKKNTK